MEAVCTTDLCKQYESHTMLASLRSAQPPRSLPLPSTCSPNSCQFRLLYQKAALCTVRKAGNKFASEFLLPRPLHLQIVFVGYVKME